MMTRLATQFAGTDAGGEKHLKLTAHLSVRRWQSVWQGDSFSPRLSANFELSVFARTRRM
jgi:hypothetical protein